ncbi:MAG: T9SS type A sorting domain-containing protein, partial [Flavobacteriales bacterium]|nr:T9SS type A sorting domain-containing protein [Flavobacteriales bacterium]
YIGASGRGTIEVFDVSGRSVYTQQAQLNNGTVRTLDLTGVAPGNYNVRLTMNGVRTEQRLMVR